jgi:hypothetical protein
VEEEIRRPLRPMQEAMMQGRPLQHLDARTNTLGLEEQVLENSRVEKRREPIEGIGLEDVVQGRTDSQPVAVYSLGARAGFVGQSPLA